MQLTVATDTDLIITVECVPEDNVGAVKGKVNAQLGLPQAQQILLFQGRELADQEVLGSVGISDGDLLMLQQRQVNAPGPQRQDSGVFGRLSREAFIEQTRRNPNAMATLDARNPELAAAIRSGDGPRVESIVSQARERELERERELAQLALNPMDVESQRRIEELIRQKNVEENFLQAVEHTPEVFSNVTMLYVNMEVNGIPVQAFVDTGAQMTIMTEEFADKCSLRRLIDKRFAGMALGVGQSKIIGRVHQAPLKVGDEYVTSSLVVLEQKVGPPFIFGLDNLIRHQCLIDLKAMKLFIGSINSEVPFLVEHQIQRMDERMLKAGGGAATSSAVSASNEASGPNISEEKIQRLMALGFGRQQCLEALRVANGNEEAAAALLYGYT